MHSQSPNGNIQNNTRIGTIRIGSTARICHMSFKNFKEKDFKMLVLRKEEANEAKEAKGSKGSKGK